MKKRIEAGRLTKEDQIKLDILKEEFKARGGMSTEELISRLDAIPFEKFMYKLSEKIKNYKKPE